MSYLLTRAFDLGGRSGAPLEELERDLQMALLYLRQALNAPIDADAARRCSIANAQALILQWIAPQIAEPQIVEPQPKGTLQ